MYIHLGKIDQSYISTQTRLYLVCPFRDQLHYCKKGEMFVDINIHGFLSMHMFARI